MKEIKLTPRELLEITVDSELLIKVDQLGLNELQLTKIQNIPPNAPKKSGKSIVRVWLENFIKDNEKALDDELKRKQELSESEEKEKQALAEVEKQIEAEKEVQSRISEAKAMIAKWLKLEVIHYISGDKLFICFEKRFSTKEQRYDREWVYLTTEEVEDRYNMFARHMGLSENIHDLLNRDGAKLSLKDVCLEQGLYYNHITSTDKANISRYYFNKLDVERRFWIHESEEFKELVDGDIKCELRPELKCLFVSMTGGKSENFDHLMQVLSWKIHKHYNSSQLPLIMIYGEEGVGKGLVFEYLLPTLVHGDNGSAEVKVDTIDGFNKILEGKVFLALNESDSSTAAQFASALKRIVGNSRLWITPKGKETYQVDNTLLYFAFTNDPKGALDLSPNSKANRRYSIMRVKEPLETWLMDYGFIESRNELKTWVSNVLIPICTNRKEMAKFAKWLLDKYPPTSIPMALHGEDYQELLSAKLTQTDQYLDELLEKMKIKTCGIGKLYGRCKYNDLLNAAKIYLQDRGEPHKDTYIEHILADFIARNGLTRHMELKSVDGEKVRNTVAWSKTGKCFDLKNNLMELS